MDISKGFAFSGNSPNNAVTAANLNNLVDQATIQTGFYLGKTEKLVPVSADYLLLWDSVSQTFQKVSVQNLVPVGAVKTGFSNLNITSILSGAKLFVAATEIVMRTVGGVPRYVSNFSATLDPFNVLGLNGRDAGSMANQTWYYVWAISNGVQDGTLLSLNSATPTLPSGFIYQALLGSWRVNATGALVQGEQSDYSVSVDLGSDASDTTSTAQIPWIAGAIFTGKEINATLNTLTAVDISRCVPPNASRVRGLLGFSSGSTAITYAVAPSNDVSHTLAGTGASIIVPNYGLQILQVSLASTGYFGFNGCASFDVAINATTFPAYAQQIFVACDNAGTRHSMRVTGYTVNL